MSDEFLCWEIPDNESSTRMRHLLDGMARNAIVLDSGKFVEINFSNHSHASFVKQEDLGRGRDESAHQVRFGQMILNGPRVREQPALVAIKPYNDRQELYREWAAHEYLNSLFGTQIGYINLGVHNDHNGTEATISEYEHDVTSLDRSFWADRSLEPSALRPELLQQHALLGMRGLGMLHGVRVTHGDAQVKNLAFDRLGPRAIDLETAEIVDSDHIGERAAVNGTQKDIAAFIESMGRVEDNLDKVQVALGARGTIEKNLDEYKYGVQMGRAALQGKSVPNFGGINRDMIHSEFEKLLKR